VLDGPFEEQLDLAEELQRRGSELCREICLWQAQLHHLLQAERQRQGELLAQEGLCALRSAEERQRLLQHSDELLQGQCDGVLQRNPTALRLAERRVY
jgi:hypothetical protein